MGGADDKRQATPNNIEGGRQSFLGLLCQGIVVFHGSQILDNLFYREHGSFRSVVSGAETVEFQIEDLSPTSALEVFKTSAHKLVFASCRTIEVLSVRALNSLDPVCFPILKRICLKLDPDSNQSVIHTQWRPFSFVLVECPLRKPTSWMQV